MMQLIIPAHITITVAAVLAEERMAVILTLRPLIQSYNECYHSGSLKYQLVQPLFLLH